MAARCAHIALLVCVGPEHSVSVLDVASHVCAACGAGSWLRHIGCHRAPSGAACPCALHCVAEPYTDLTPLRGR